MSFTELLEAAKSLPRAEQLQLVEGLQEPPRLPPSQEELMAKYFPPGATFDVWSPYDAFEAAEVLQRLLAEKRTKS